MLLFNFGNALEHTCDFVEAFFARNASKFRIHLRPLVIFAARSRNKVGLSVANARKKLEPHLCVLLFVSRSFFEDCRNLVVPLFFRNGSKIGVLIAGLAFA